MIGVNDVNSLSFFFFQAEDGIRDVAVTGVQTCALPISGAVTAAPTITNGIMGGWAVTSSGGATMNVPLIDDWATIDDSRNVIRSEERRVGKECRSRW